jgi:hypothetical protein
MYGFTYSKYVLQDPKTYNSLKIYEIEYFYYFVRSRKNIEYFFFNIPGFKDRI